MSIYNVPRCQHLKVNGTQCGSPALKRNRFCFFHKRFQEEQIKLNGDRSRRGRANFYLPVLEDANSIQISLMQIMRLLASGQIDSKIAGLLLYALQTASFNLRRLSFEPTHIRGVVIDRRTIDQTCIGCDQWCDEDFPDPEPTEEEKAQAAAEEAAEAAAAARAAAKEKARHNAALEAEADRLIRQGAAQRAALALQTPPPPQPAIPNPRPAQLNHSAAPGPAPSPTPQPPSPPAPAPRPAAAQAPHPAVTTKQASPPEVRRSPSSAKLKHKKPPKKVDMNRVREKIRGKVRDWVMSTAKQSTQPASRNGRLVAKGQRLEAHS
jgi:pyruvate/2-oxoglutarate dehydrogenase complex dihydrolipoamide acyltransferase (E2) component